MFTYKTIGVCSREIHFDIVDGKLHNVSFDAAAPETWLLSASW